MSTKPLAAFIMQHVFGISARVAAAHFAVPDPDADSAAGDAAAFDMHGASHALNHRLLVGHGAKALTSRFQTLFADMMAGKRDVVGVAGAEGVEDDLLRFFRHDVGKVALDAVFGPALLEQSPGFLEDFWTFDEYVPAFLARVPRFLVSKAYGARQRALDALRTWQDHEFGGAARWEKDGGAVGGGERDEVAAVFEERYGIMKELDRYDPVSMAAQELSFVYA